MYFFELSVFWHFFGYFSSNAIHFLVVNKKIVSYFEKFKWVVVSYDWRIWWVVSCKSVFYRKGLRVFRQGLSLNKQPYMKWSLSLKAPNIGIIFSSYTLTYRVTTVYWPAKINKSQIYLFQLELWDSGETATRKYNHILPVLLWTFLSLMFTQVIYLSLLSLGGEAEHLSFCLRFLIHG